MQSNITKHNGGRRSIVLNLPLQLAFPGGGHLHLVLSETGFADGFTFDGGRRSVTGSTNVSELGKSFKDFGIRILDTDHVVFPDCQIAANLKFGKNRNSKYRHFYGRNL